MSSSVLKSTLLTSGVAACALLLASGAALAQSTVTLTASPQSTTLPDGQVVPMWGYTCSSPSGTGVSCTAMSGVPQTTGWQPPLITVPAGSLTITLRNNLPPKVPTSLVLVGQLGGGLGAAPARMPSPPHGAQGTTWPGTLGAIDPATAAITVDVPGAGYVNGPAVTISGGGGSGAAAVAYIANGAVTKVTISSPGSGYTAAPTVAIAPPPCTINSTTCIRATATISVSVLQSSTGDAIFVPPAQADRVRSFGTEVAPGGTQTLCWGSDCTGTTLKADLRPGTYLIESGTQPSIQGPMGLYGVLVVTESSANCTGAPNCVYPNLNAAATGTTFDKDVALLLSEIDPVQNIEVDQVVQNADFSDATVWNGQTGQCGDVTAPAITHTCYPPAVNYTPLYYLLNGVSFDATAPALSSLAVPDTGTQTRVLLRLVNAGLHMHVPSVVGAPMTLVAEDGNKLPGLPRVQNEVQLAAGKTYDVTIAPSTTTTTSSTCTTAPCYTPATYAVFDRALGLSTNNNLDGGMQAYLKFGTGATSGAGSSASARALLGAADQTFYCVNGTTLSVTDASKGLLKSVTGANGVALGTTFTGAVQASNVTLQSNGTFTYAPPGTGECAGSFAFKINNGATPYTASILNCSLSAACVGGRPVAGPGTYTSNIATRAQVSPPGLLTNVTNSSGFALKASAGTTTGGTCTNVSVNPDGSFLATPPTVGAPSCTFYYNVSTSTLQTSENDGKVTVNFLAPSNLIVNVMDAKHPSATAITDYRWIIEEDKTFWIDPKCQVNTTVAHNGSDGTTACPTISPTNPVESLGYNFHTAHMDVVAQGCVGAISCEAGQTLQGAAATCDIGDGACRAVADNSNLHVLVDSAAGQKTPLDPKDVHLDANKRYFISILPGDGVNPTIGGAGGPDDAGNPFSIDAVCLPYAGPTGAWEPGAAGAICGHAMGGAQIAAGQTAVDIKLQETPLPTAKIAVFVFEDDNPLNGENDAGGGVDVLAPNEAGLGGFEVKLFDQAGGLGDATGQITYDMFNQPVSNALAGKIDPVTGLDSCPISRRTDGLVGMIPTCPRFEADGRTLSPLEGQVVIANLYPGLYEITATPAADRIARGEEWLQTNTLDGGKPHEAFIKPDEPGYFQEFGPGGFHVSIGFANPKIINDRKAGFCNANAGGCNGTLNLQVTNAHMSRTPDQRTYSSETYDHYGFTNCYVSIGPADAEDFAFQKCNPDGTVNFTGMPTGVFKISVFDQWNDIMLDGLVGTVTIDNSDMPKVFPVTQWRTNLLTRTYIDSNGNGIPDRNADGTDKEAGLALVNTNIHYRDGSIGFFNNTDLNGYAGFNEVFPFMNWLVVETSSTRFKPTGVHTVYDAGGPVDCSSEATAAGMPCSSTAANIANTAVRVPLPADLRMPGAKYCHTADCLPGDAADGASTGTIFPPQPSGTTQGWQGLLGQNTFMEFGVKAFNPGENGGISGMVVYASTRPFDDPALSLQLSWEPGVPRAKINLYSKTVDASGNEVLKLVDTTTTASWDDWAQGFRKDSSGALMTAASGGYIPNMNCPGQSADSPFFATLKNSKQWLDTPGAKKALAYNSQFKCYDGWSQLNQVQPAPYDGLYKFPSVNTVDATGKPASSSCHMSTAAEPWGCKLNTTAAPTDWDYNKPMLVAGKYVVEIILPPGYELVKEEDKNILLGDVYIAPVTQQFAGFGNIFIMPDQAAVNAAYNPHNPGSLDLTTNTGASPRHEGDTGSVEQFWPCVGAERIVPDLNSLYPGAGQQAPFAGAKRKLCDRKEVTVQNEGAALAKFFIFSSAHIAGHFAGTITNDFASEFDPFSPQFGEKFGPPNLPVAMRDFTGNEVARVYSDQWGIYNGLYFSSYSVNPPNPTGYVPQMSIACMNDPGPIPGPAGTMITDPAYNPAYSNFCYETPFMPGFTAYMDTPVIPTQAFADGYNLPDTEYPDGTPAIKSVVSSAAPGPWVTPGSPAIAAAPATVTFAISGVARPTSDASTSGDSISSITVGGTAITSGTITCIFSAHTGCRDSSPGTRNVSMATLVRQNINAAPVSVAGIVYTAGGSGTNVTLTAGTAGSTPNGTAVVVNTTNVNISPSSSLQLAGGADAAPAVPPSMSLTITALGDKIVQNPNYAGPNATGAPFNQKTIQRRYSFGSTLGVVTVGIDSRGRPIPATVSSWSDTQINITVPNGSSDGTQTTVADRMPLCTLQQQGSGGARCGELVITRGDNGKQSIDAITVTAGGSAPWIVTPNDFASNTGGTVTAPAGKSVKDYTANFGRMFFSPIQTALDSADPGDLILVQPGTYRENLIMWKPVRLQGVGASSVTINADAHPAGKMEQWRRQVVCAFGLNLDGVPNLDNSPTGFDPTRKYSCPDAMFLKADRIPFEAITGWDASGNGNLAQVLQEPTLMGAYEGAGITVVGRGVRIPANSTDYWGNDPAAAGAFADGSVYLSSNDCTSTGSGNLNKDYATSNYLCNPSSIDGVSVINSSQGGGGIFVHGWGHNLEIANTRVSGNHGTLAGAINLGNGETPPVFVNDGTICGAGTTTLCPPIPANTPTGATIPFGFNTHVRIHHNMLYNNASIGDALFTGTPAGAGGVTVSAGGDNYRIDHNWIAGNLSTGDGGGLQSLGVTFDGLIKSNYILFNQSTNPTLPTNGGGIVIQGANEPRSINGQECGATTDFDCPPGLGDGTGARLVIDGNLVLGNSAESGSGGGISLQSINGSELIAFPLLNSRWYGVTLSNNIIANNVAGWDGGGVSMQDALMVTLVNNTIASNDTTASAGALFKTLGAVNVGSTPPGCTNNPTQEQNLTCPQDGAPHAPQPAGLVTLAHTPNLIEAIAGLPSVAGVRVLCPVPSGQGFGYTGALGVNGDCMKVSKPRLVNDLFWHNRAFAVNVVDPTGAVVGNGDGTGTPTGTGLLSQQNLIAVTPLLNQTATGQCVAPTGTVPSTFYYDVGLRTDDVAAGNASFTTNKLVSDYSIISGDPQNVVTKNHPVTATTSPFIADFCNGARVAPEKGSAYNGYNAPPGASETTGLATVFVFNGIKPTATVDEGHNWLNLSYGPLTLNRSAVQTSTNPPELMVASASVGVAGGAYSIPGTLPSPAAGQGVVNGLTPAADFFGRTRSTSATSVGAVEVSVAQQPPVLNSITPTSGNQGATVSATLAGMNLLGASAVNVSGAGVACSVTGTPTATSVAASCVIGATAALGARTVSVTTPGGTSGTVAFTVNTAPPVVALNCPGNFVQQVACVLLGTYPFGNVTSNATQTFTLSNTGVGSFVISTIVATKTNGGSGTYSVTGGTCAANATIAGGGSCTVAVTFASPTNSSTNGTLTVAGTGIGGVGSFSATRNLSGN